MTPAQYRKILAVAEDERGDPATRAAAQRKVETWRAKMEGPKQNPLHPGRVQTEEYKRWVMDMAVGNRERR